MCCLICILTSFGFPVFTAYMVRRTSKVSSFLPIDSKNFGLSGNNVITMKLYTFNKLTQIKNTRHDVIFTPKKLKLNSNGMITHAKRGNVAKMAGKNVDTNAAARLRVLK